MATASLVTSLGAPLSALAARCASAVAAVDQSHAARVRERLQDVQIELYDGNFQLHHVIRDDEDFKFSDIENDTGPGKIMHFGDSPAAQWLWDMYGRKAASQTIDVFIAVKYSGIRWGGRLKKCIMRTDALGNSKLESQWESDYEQFKWRDLWATPTTPAGFQPIKVFGLGGPTDWVLGTSLWLNLSRAHGRPVGWTTDPLSITDADYTNWPIVVRPDSYQAAKERGTPTGLVLSRFKTWHEAAEAMLEDAGLTVRYQRYLPGDPLPWEGARISYGTLVVWFEDNTGGLGTSVSGSIASGIGQMARIFLSSVVEGIGGGSLPIEEGEEAITGLPIPDKYMEPGYIGTQPTRPYVFYPATSPGLVSVEAHLEGARGLRLTTGGHSAPMVNEVISAGVQAIGDALAAIPAAPIPPLGGVADALLKPFYTDVIAAFMTVYLVNRANDMSWATLYEKFLEGSDKAYTLASTMVLREGMRATSTMFSAKMEIIDGAPFWVGGDGVGDMRLGTRVLMQVPGDETGRIFSERIVRLDLEGSTKQVPTWSPIIGDIEPSEDAFNKGLRRLRKVISSLKQSGVL